jgi:hypothetical protein
MENFNRFEVGGKSSLPKSNRRRYVVGKTKIPGAPWEEDRYIYDVKSGNDSIFSGEFWVAVIQIIFGIIFFIWFYNSL